MELIMRMVAWLLIIGSITALISAFPFLGLIALGVVGIGLLAQFQED